MLVGLVLGVAVALLVLAVIGLVLVRWMDPRRQLEALARSGPDARRQGWRRRLSRNDSRRSVRVFHSNTRG